MRVPTLAALAILVLMIPGAWAQDEGADYDVAGDGSGAVFQANREVSRGCEAVASCLGHPLSWRTRS